MKQRGFQLLHISKLPESEVHSLQVDTLRTLLLQLLPDLSDRSRNIKVDLLSKLVLKPVRMLIWYRLSASVRVLQPFSSVGLPIGFSHAPAVKRRLMRSEVPFITIEGTFRGGLLAAVVLNALVESLIEKLDCHCYLS